jgi:hypothetical protein
VRSDEAHDFPRRSGHVRHRVDRGSGPGKESRSRPSNARKSSTVSRSPSRFSTPGARLTKSGWSPWHSGGGRFLTEHPQGRVLLRRLRPHFQGPTSTSAPAPPRNGPAPQGNRILPHRKTQQVCSSTSVESAARSLLPVLVSRDELSRERMDTTSRRIMAIDCGAWSLRIRLVSSVGVFCECDIENPVPRVLDAPVAANPLRQSAHFRRQARQAVRHVSGLFPVDHSRADHHQERGQSRPRFVSTST